MSTENSSSNSESDITIKELVFKLRKAFTYLLSKWIVILFFGIIGGVLGFTYAYFRKPVYTATTTFVLESGDGASTLGQYSGLVSMMGLDLGGGGGGIFQGDNILQLYKSRTMIEKTLLSKINYKEKTLLLIDYYIEFNHLREIWKEKKELKGLHFGSDSNFQKIKFTRLQDSVLGTIVADINKNYLSVAKPDKKLNIIKVDVRAKDEFFAKSLNDQIVKNVNDFYVQTKTKKSLENTIILKQKADSVRSVMNGAIYSAAAIADATPNLNPTRQTQRVAPIQRSQFTAETNKAILGELVKNLEMSKITLLKETPLIQVVDQPVFPLDKERLGKIKAAILGGMLSGFFIVMILLLKKMFKKIMA